MFEKSLADKLKRIFDLDKVTFDLPSESQEQECIFIDVKTSAGRVKDGFFTAKVTGGVRIYANSEKMPYGYLTKRIVEAKPEDTKDLFFYDFEENAGQFRNISERSMSFIYLFDSQYNPNVGEIEGLITNVEFEGE